jgi:hypothetical protein
MPIPITVKELIAKVGPRGITQHDVERNCRGALRDNLDLLWKHAEEDLFVVSQAEIRKYFNLPEADKVPIAAPPQEEERPIAHVEGPEPEAEEPVDEPEEFEEFIQGQEEDTQEIPKE